MDDFDFSFQPGINKRELLEFTSLGFIERNENILFVGTSGVGKTHLAKRDILEATCNRLTSNLLAGVDTVIEIMQDASNSAQIRLNASQQLFNVTLRLNEQIEVLERLQKLEERFADVYRIELIN